MLIHAVYFWLKADLIPPRARRFFARGEEAVRGKTIDKIYVATPAKIAERSVTERSFDVSETIILRTALPMTPTRSTRFISPLLRGTSRLWTKVLVYDSEE